MISIKNLNKSFGDNKVLDNISCEIKNGEIIGMLGPNGAGKTTTLRILIGFLSADEGEIKINGKNIDNPEEALHIKKIIGYLPENNPLYPEMLVEEYLKMMAELKQIPKEKQKWK